MRGQSLLPLFLLLLLPSPSLAEVCNWSAGWLIVLGPLNLAFVVLIFVLLCHNKQRNFAKAMRYQMDKQAHQAREREQQQEAPPPTAKQLSDTGKGGVLAAVAVGGKKEDEELIELLRDENLKLQAENTRLLAANLKLQQRADRFSQQIRTYEQAISGKSDEPEISAADARFLEGIYDDELGDDEEGGGYTAVADIKEKVGTARGKSALQDKTQPARKSRRANVAVAPTVGTNGEEMRTKGNSSLSFVIPNAPTRNSTPYDGRD